MPARLVRQQREVVPLWDGVGTRFSMGEIVAYGSRGTAVAPAERRLGERRADQRRQGERRRLDARPPWPDAGFVAQVLCGRGPAVETPANGARPSSGAPRRAGHPALAAYEEAVALARRRADPDEVDRAV